MFKSNRLEQKSQDIAKGKRGYPQQTRGSRQSFLVALKNTIKVCYKAEAALLQCQDLEKKDSNPEKSDEETEKKAENDEDEAEEEKYDEEDIEEVCENVLDELNLSYKNNRIFAGKRLH